MLCLCRAPWICTEGYIPTMQCMRVRSYILNNVPLCTCQDKLWTGHSCQHGRSLVWRAFDGKRRRRESTKDREVEGRAARAKRIEGRAARADQRGPMQREQPSNGVCTLRARAFAELSFPVVSSSIPTPSPERISRLTKIDNHVRPLAMIAD